MMTMMIMMMTMMMMMTMRMMMMMMMTMLSHSENHPRSKWKEGTIYDLGRGGDGGEGGGSLSPGRSGIRGPAHPFASQSKTQGSPLGGYLS